MRMLTSINKIFNYNNYNNNNNNNCSIKNITDRKLVIWYNFRAIQQMGHTISIREIPIVTILGLRIIIIQGVIYTIIIIKMIQLLISKTIIRLINKTGTPLYSIRI